MGYPRGSLTRVPVVDDVDSQQATRLSLREIWAGLVLERDFPEQLRASLSVVIITEFVASDKEI